MRESRGKLKGDDAVAQGPFCPLPGSALRQQTTPIEPPAQRRSSLFDRPITSPTRTASTPKEVALSARNAPQLELHIELLSFLIVDDVIPSCHVVHTILRSIGIPANQIYIATNLADAVRVMRTTSIQVIISDLNLKDGSGLDLLHSIRANSETKHMPFVLVTNTPDLSHVTEAKKLGVSSCLVKPLSVSNLQHHIEYAVRSCST
jgi:two-component system chemotaxis response regulator CheY